MFNQINQNHFYELRIQQLEQIIKQKDTEIAFLKQQIYSFGININSPFGNQNLNNLNNINNNQNQNQINFMNNPLMSNNNENRKKYDFIEDYGYINIETCGIIKTNIDCFIYEKAIIPMTKIAEKLGKSIKDLQFISLGHGIKELKPQLTLEEIGIYDNSLISVKEREINQIDNNFDNFNINQKVEKTNVKYINFLFKSDEGNRSTIVLNENIPIGIALLLYLIKAGRESDLFDLIQGKNTIYFLYNSRKLNISDKTRIKNIFTNSISQIEVFHNKII